MEEIMEELIIEPNLLCKRCHRKLKDDKSKTLGFGPICYNKYLKQQKTYLFEIGANNETFNDK